MTIVIEDLKYDSHKPSSKHALAILIIFPRHASLLMIYLRWLQDSLSGSGADKLLHLLMAFVNSPFENGGYSSDGLSEISSEISTSTW